MIVWNTLNAVSAFATKRFALSAPPRTEIASTIWFLAKNKKQKGKTLFIDARKLGTMVTRKLRELTDEDIKKIADTYNAYVDGTLEDEKGFCAVVTTQDIAK